MKSEAELFKFLPFRSYQFSDFLTLASTNTSKQESNLQNVPYFYRTWSKINTSSIKKYENSVRKDESFTTSRHRFTMKENIKRNKKNNNLLLIPINIET